MIVLTVFLGIENKITIELRTQKVREFLKLAIYLYTHIYVWFRWY
jgi:hypothetical protein